MESTTLGAQIHAAFHEPATQVYRVVQGTIWVLILLSIAMLVSEPFLPQDERIIVPFRIVDRVLLGVFALEYILRVASHRPPALEVFQPGPLITLQTHLVARIR